MWQNAGGALLFFWPFSCVTYLIIHKLTRILGIVSSQRACKHCIAGNPNMDHSEDNYARKHVWTNRVEPNSSLSYLKKMCILFSQYHPTTLLVVCCIFLQPYWLYLPSNLLVVSSFNPTGCIFLQLYWLNLPSILLIVLYHPPIPLAVSSPSPTGCIFL